MDGKVLIFSAPSGSGKTTIVNRLLSNNSNLSFSISSTTRSPRPHEKNGIHYNFISVSEFKNLINDDKFIEWEQVYEGLFYGTLKREVERIWKNNQTVVFDVDVKGGLSLKKYFGNNALSFFIDVPTIEVLRSRLEKRGTDSQKSIDERIKKAEYERSFKESFDRVIVNQELEKAITNAESMINEYLAG